MKDTVCCQMFGEVRFTFVKSEVVVVKMMVKDVRIRIDNVMMRNAT